MELTVGVSRTATLHEPTNQITVRGTVACTRPVGPVDVESIVLEQGGFSQRSGLVGIDDCEGPEGQPWSATFTMGERFVYGPLDGMEVRVCTNPSREIDEDCVIVTRKGDAFGNLRLVEG